MVAIGGGNVISVLDIAGPGDPGGGGPDDARAPSTAGNVQPATDPLVTDVAARRRQAVEAGHRGDRLTLARLSADPDPAVRGAALGAFARAGGIDLEQLTRSLADPEPAVRRRACEEAGRALAAGSPAHAIVRLVLRALDDTDPAVTEVAAWALGEAGSTGATAVGRLVRLTREGPALCREAAVAALGAIGDPRGLPAVLEALEDRPAVRRRATVALAAFDDPTAEEGLRRVATDRDWQVRQAAEDLLGGR